MSEKLGARRRVLASGLVALAVCVGAWSRGALADEEVVPPAVKGKLVGYLDLTNEGWADAKDPAKHGYSFREPVLTVTAEHRNQYPILPAEVVVVLLGDPAGAEKRPVKLRISGGRISQSTIVVRPGTSVEFANKDAFVHRLYAVDQASFPPSETAVDGAREWKVPDKGVYEIRDQAAPNLHMWIVSDPKAVGSVPPDLKGDFRLPAPEGEYQVQVFFGGQAVSTPRPLSMKQRDIEWANQPIKVAPVKKAASAGGEKK